MADHLQVQESGTACANCGLRPGTECWGDALAMTHGWAQMWCKVCVLTKQIEHARERASALPDLERELEEERRQW